MGWGQKERDEWLESQVIRRSYRDDVVRRIQALSGRFNVIQYGALSVNPEKYPVYLLQSKNFDLNRKTVLITGGVHGYETSGIFGAIEFLKTLDEEESLAFNFVCAPCISPWAYETVNRWNVDAVDPNRSFCEPSAAEESRLLFEIIEKLALEFYAHFDLHETTDTDNSVFRPALERRDGIVLEFSEIPDGFYTVGDTENPRAEFQKAIIDAVRKVTHIAPADAAGKIIGEPIQQEGVINYPVKSLYLCAGLTSATFTTTTEVYPDSPKVTPELCVQAQVAAIKGGLDYLKRNSL